MRFPLTRTVGYRLCKKGELGCPDCVYCVTDRVIQVTTKKGTSNCSLRHSRYCISTKGKPSVAKDCRCDNFLKIRSGTESCA